MDNYYDGLNEKLLAAIPQDARQVLELGCANGRLGRRFKELNPAVRWWGVERDTQAATLASRYLDNVIQLDLDQADLTRLNARFDTIILGDVLEHVRDPARLLQSLYDATFDGARLICCLPNMAHLSVIERMLTGDITYDAAGLLDQTHLRFYSPASAFKVFLDAGWLPDLVDQYRVEVPQTDFALRVVEAASTLGVPVETAVHNLGCYQMIIACRKWAMEQLRVEGAFAPISAIVPVNRPWQYHLNIARSPGLAEINAEIIPVEGASSAAEAFASGSARARHGWRLMVHQDVYFPAGSGFALAKQLGILEKAGYVDGPIGLAGLGADLEDGTPGADSPRHAGMVIDRTRLFQHPGSLDALSVDEFAVALHRDAQVQLDPALGWHLWATDLCLQSARLARPNGRAMIIEAPLFHNSTTAWTLPEAFNQSAERLLAKYPGAESIPTLCGELKRDTVAQPGVAQPA